MPYHFSRIAVISMSLSSLLLAGCAGFEGAAFPNVPATTGSVGAISGSVYGGHAPLAGSHVYVLEGNMTSYGGLATSLLSGTGTTVNTADPSIPTTGTGTPWSYVLADANGAFNLTGKYSCTEGDLVYLYAYGGSATYPSGTNTFNVGGAGGTAGTASETFLSGGVLSGVALGAAGSRYTAGTHTGIAATGGGGTGAVATIVVSIFGNVTSITLTSAGSGYTSLPTFTPPGTGGTGFTYTGTLSPIVDEVQFTVAATSVAGVAGPPQNFYPGEVVSFSGLGSPLSTVLTGSQAVVADGLTTTTFDVQIAGGTVGSAAGTTSIAVSAGATVTGAPAFNPGIVNLAVLGVCPSSGSFAAGGTLPSGATFSPIQYVFMNEVSTVAAAYALEGFTIAADNDMLHVGTSTTNAIGLQNATNVAGQLYDIQGKYLTTSYAGEGHIASPNTTNGNGIVPQATLDTLGNILAACVDSHNISGTVSPQCNTLFTYATSNGIPVGSAGAGTKANDTATAALYIAKNPAGAAANTTAFMTNLYALPTGNVPFTPHLTTQPNDFTVAIQYPQSLNTVVAGAESVGIDGNGNPWFDSLANGTIYEMNPVGVVTYTSPGLGFNTYSYLTIDPSNRVWVANRQTSGVETEFVPTVVSPTSTTAVVNTFGGPYTGSYWYGFTSVANSTGNIYFAGVNPAGSPTLGSAVWQTLGLTSTGTQLTNFPHSNTLNAGDNVQHGTLENIATGGDIWWTAENTYAVVRLDPTTGVVASGFPIFTTGTAGATHTAALSSPEMPSTDSASNLWVANYDNSTVFKITTAGVVTQPSGGTLDSPFGVSVDGASNVYIVNRATTGAGASSVTVYNGSTSTAISPATNYTLGGQLTAPLNIAMDQSGNAWITSYDANMVVQWVGAGSPLTNPLSYASGQNKLGKNP